MMDSVTEEESLCICLKRLIISTLPITLIVCDNILHHLSDRKIILAVLHPDDVTTILRSLSKVIDIFLLLKRKFVPSRNLISHNLKIGKLIDKILEVPVLRRLFCLVRTRH